MNNLMIFLSIAIDYAGLIAKTFTLSIVVGAGLVYGASLVAGINARGRRS